MRGSVTGNDEGRFSRSGEILLPARVLSRLIGQHRMSLRETAVIRAPSASAAGYGGTSSVCRRPTSFPNTLPHGFAPDIPSCPAPCAGPPRRHRRTKRHDV